VLKSFISARERRLGGMICLRSGYGVHWRFPFPSNVIPKFSSRLTYHYTNEEEGKTLRRNWTTACQACALKSKCTTGKERRISQWEHKAVLEAVQAWLDRNAARYTIVNPRAA
jgi:hypothetical protein